jgi:DNA-binding beta-propeller fold protein YncE
VISRDGRSVYVSGETSVAGFRRQPSGALHQLSGKPACVFTHVDTLPRIACVPARLLWPTSLALSPNGRNLYVASHRPEAQMVSNRISSLTVFARNRQSGALRQLAGKTYCIADGLEGCAPGRASYGPQAVAVSPDGRSVYVASEGGLAAFARDRQSGALRQLKGAAGCLLARESGCSYYRDAWIIASGSPTVLAVSPDGRNVYVLVANQFDDAPAALFSFRRNPKTGALKRLAGTDGCVGSPTLNKTGCGSGAGLSGPANCFSLALSPGGANLYVGSCGGVAVFQRDPSSGRLSQLPGIAGCIDASGLPGIPCREKCPTSPQTAVAVSTDGENVYFAFQFSHFVSGKKQPAGITVFSREQTDGSLTRLNGKAGCITTVSPVGTCTKARAIDTLSGLALSPDGRSVYVVTKGSVAVFRRAGG